jgi:hypothetical protein
LCRHQKLPPGTTLQRRSSTLFSAARLDSEQDQQEGGRDFGVLVQVAEAIVTANGAHVTKESQIAFISFVRVVVVGQTPDGALDTSAKFMRILDLAGLAIEVDKKRALGASEL